MDYKEFEKLILTYQKFNKDSSELYKLGINIFDGHFNLAEQCSKILDIVLNTLFKEEGVDWVNWFIFENDFGNKDWSGLIYFKDSNGKIITEEKQSLTGHGAQDKDGNSICYDLPSLWETVKKYKKVRKTI